MLGWYEQEDYSNYPENEMCDYDRMCIWIRQQNYTPNTTMENLITMMFLHADDSQNIDEVKQMVIESGGCKEFDYHC